MATINGTARDDILYGTNSADTINGKSGNDILYGGAGNDTINGGAGKDQLYGEAGSDDLYGGDGNDTLQGGAGNDYLYGEDGDDHLYGDEGADRLYGGAGNDMLIGGKFTYSSEAENDYLDGGEGADRMYGGNGNDTYVIDNTGDGVYEKEGYGTDTVISKLQEFTLPDNVEIGKFDSSVSLGIAHGNNLDNTLYGISNSGTTLYGEGGNDTLKGGNLSDVLDGGTGDDVLDGGKYGDKLYGGAGDDTYLMRKGSGTDTISDVSGNDTILFESTVSKDNIAIFLDSDGTLFIDYGAEYADNDRIKVLDQGTNTIENIVMKEDGSTLTSSAINQLIQDMSAYATENGITISSVEDVKANADLMNMINSAWT